MTGKEIETKAKRIKTLENRQNQLEAEIDQLKDELKAELERQGKDEVAAGAFRILWKMMQERRFNTNRFKTENPGVYDSYGGSVGALKSMGALEKGLQENELQPIVTAWRNASPHIVRFWWTIDEAVKSAIRKQEEQTIRIPNSTAAIRIVHQSGMLFITLPSGRRLSYIKPSIEENQYGSESVTYMGQDAQRKWTRIESYGPKFVENIVQAISRDLLAEAMKRLNNHHYNIVGHVHDEVIIEAPPTTTVQAICEIMQKTPGWFRGSEPTVSPAGCPAQPEGRRASQSKQAAASLQEAAAPTEIADIDLRADGYECGYYMKS